MFTGSIVAIVTPFNANGSINFEKLTELLEWHITEGTNGIVVCGTTGESPTLSDEEQLAIISHTVKVINKRIPVIAGAGSNNSQHGLHLSQAAEKAGADGLLLITPYYNKTNEEGLYQHFKTVAEKVNIPIILYNVPSRTNMNIPINVLKRLAELKNIVAIKEASGNLDYVLKVAKEVPSLIILSGNDSQVIPILSLGGLGVISVFANIFPNAMAEMCAKYAKGELREAMTLQVKYANFIEALFIETNPIPVKEAMNLQGMNVGAYRLPLWEMSEKNKAILVEELNKCK